MISERGVAMLHGMDGSAGGDWAARSPTAMSPSARSGCSTLRPPLAGAEATFTTVRNLPDAPAVFVRVDVHRASRKRGT